ncbi:MAG: hypothetical protein V2I48_14155 [Xanthomonadales bacterium]|jgi:hypothetical protein|nr:hypothetical protein [Xanthomonadales bacterium]
MNEQELLKRIAALPREMPPERDPWAQISRRLDDRVGAPDAPALMVRRGSWLQSWPLRAVAAVAVVAIAIVLMSGPETVQQQPVVNQPVNSAVVSSTAIPVVLAGSEAEYQAAFREFIAIGDSRNQIPAVTVEKIETGWAELLQVETALSDALAQNPNDSFLNKRMLELRARQLGFLRQLASLDHSNRRLTI